MIGIEFELKSNYESIIYSILKDVDVEKYKWVIVQQEVIFENDFNKKLPSIIEGKKFCEKFQNDGGYFVNQLNMQAYFSDSKISKINNYNDFLNNECQIIVLFSDNKVVEVYAKEKKVLEVIINYLKDISIDFSIKTLENDARTLMYV